MGLDRGENNLVRSLLGRVGSAMRRWGEESFHMDAMRPDDPGDRPSGQTCEMCEEELTLHELATCLENRLDEELFDDPHVLAKKPPIMRGLLCEYCDHVLNDD